MQRRTHLLSTALAAALTSALAAGLAGCSGDSGSDGDIDGEAGNAPSASHAEPGKYETLPEPCGAVQLDTLRDLLPLAETSTAAEKPDEAESSGTPRAYEGEPTVTYDTDRRVGCRWKSSTSLGSRHLHVDFERVVSYDSESSDEDKAEQLFEEKAGEADIRLDSASPTPSDAEKPSGDGNETKTTTTSSASPSGGADPSGSGASPPATAPSSPPASLSPRTLDDIGDAAFINDVLDTTDSGVHRDITLVFRTSNVLVTVEYAQWMTDKNHIPDSAELQENAESLAKDLASAFDDD